MMQSCRRPEHGSSGELDVFGATSYFAAGCLPAPPDYDCPPTPSSATEPFADRLYFQAKLLQRDTSSRATEDKSFRSPHQQQQQPPPPGVHANKQLVVVAAAKRRQASSGKSKLAALLSFMVSPSPSPRAASFRKDKDKKKKKQEALSSTATQAEVASEAGSEKGSTYNYKTAGINSPSSWSRASSMQLQGLFGAHDDDYDDELDLGVATGDKRLQGITVVRRGGGGAAEERWVVRCVTGGAWDDEEHREKMLDASAAESAAASSEQNMIHDDEDGNVDDPSAAQYSWESDSSSDLFDLDLEYK